MPITEVGVELGWGPAKLSGVWRPDQAERDAAWELYVELVTRIAVVPLAPGHGARAQVQHPGTGFPALVGSRQTEGSTR